MVQGQARRSGYLYKLVQIDTMILQPCCRTERLDRHVHAEFKCLWNVIVGYVNMQINLLTPVLVDLLVTRP